MEKLLHLAVGKHIVLSLLVLMSLSVFGCSGVGWVVPADHRLPFSEKDTGQGNYSYGGLTVEYSYSMFGEHMTMDGQVHYSSSVDSLAVVRLLFLDASGTVLQQNIVYSSGYRVARYSRKTDWTFQETLVVPPGVAGLSFSYSAQPSSSYK